jgi:hypothetical protein
VNFIRVSAAVRPVEIDPTGAVAHRYNACQKIHPPEMAEIYFWLTPAEYVSGSSTDMLKI